MKNFGKSSRGYSQGVSKFFKAPIYTWGAHCVVNFVIAQLLVTVIQFKDFVVNFVAEFAEFASVYKFDASSIQLPMLNYKVHPFVDIHSAYFKCIQLGLYTHTYTHIHTYFTYVHLICSNKRLKHNKNTTNAISSTYNRAHVTYSCPIIAYIQQLNTQSIR